MLPPTRNDRNQSDIEKWQPERVPIDSASGPLQKPLSPEWGGRYTFAIRNGLEIKLPSPIPYILHKGTAKFGTSPKVNPQFVEQAKRIVYASAALTPQQRLSAEAWEAGAGTGYPPGVG